MNLDGFTKIDITSPEYQSTLSEKDKKKTLKLIKFIDDCLNSDEVKEFQRKKFLELATYGSAQYSQKEIKQLLKSKKI